MAGFTTPNNIDDGWLYAYLLSRLQTDDTPAMMQNILRNQTGRQFIVHMRRATEISPRFAFGYADGYVVIIVGCSPSFNWGQGLVTRYANVRAIDPDTLMNAWAADAAREIIADIAVARPGALAFSMHLAGHSGGGNVAMAIGAIKKNAVPAHDVTCRTFGTPRIGKLAWNQRGRRFPTNRWMNIGDPIPLFPPVGEELSVLGDRQAALALWGTWFHHYAGCMLRPDGLPPLVVPDTGARLPSCVPTALLAWLTGLMAMPVNEHRIELYEARLLASIPNLTDATGTSEGGSWGQVPIPATTTSPPPAPMLQSPVYPVQPSAAPRPIMTNTDPQYNRPIGVTANNSVVRPASYFYPFHADTGWEVRQNGIPVVKCRSRQEAVRTARNMNAAAGVWSNDPSRDQATLLNAMTIAFSPRES